MLKPLLVRIESLESSSDEWLPPGDARIWDALRQSLGKVKCSASTVVFLGAGGALPSDQQLMSWLGFPGMHKISILREVSTLALQVRRLGREPDALATLLAEQLQRDGFKGPYEIWVARQFEFENSEPLLAALNKMLTVGARSGVFHPSLDEARVTGPQDPIVWPSKSPKMENLKEAYQAAYLQGYWATLHRQYRIEEHRPRQPVERRDLLDPLVHEFQTPGLGESERAEESFAAPLSFVVGMPSVFNIQSNPRQLQHEAEKTSALYDRAIGALVMRDHPVAHLTIDTLSPLPLNQKTLPASPNARHGLFLIGPWDARNALIERRIETWVRQHAREALRYGELVDGEQDLILYFTRIFSREPGWSVRMDDAKDLIFKNSQKGPSQRAWFFWSTVDESVLVQSARRHGVPFIVLGRSTDTGRCDFIREGGGMDSLKLSAFKSEPHDVVEVKWTYPDLKAPTYGFDKAAVHPDQFLLKVTARDMRAKAWNDKSQLWLTGERLRSVRARRHEATPVNYFRWTDGRKIWLESLGFKQGWMEVDPKAAGAAAVDLAIRGVVAMGGKPTGGVAQIWATQPEIEEASDKLEEGAHQWGAYILALEGACSALRQFEYELHAINGAGAAFPRNPQEIVAKVRAAATSKINPILPGFRMTGEVLYAIGPKPPFVDSGSRILNHVRVMSNHTMRLSVAMQLEIYSIVHDLILKGKVTCIRPVGEGGLAETLGEMALWGGMGAQIRPNLPVIEMFSASPGRFVVGILPQEAKTVESLVKSEWLTALGTTGGEKILGLPLVEFLEARGAT